VITAPAEELGLDSQVDSGSKQGSTVKRKRGEKKKRFNFHESELVKKQLDSSHRMSMQNKLKKLSNQGSTLSAKVKILPSL